MPETPWGELVLHTVLLRADSEYVYAHTHAYMHAHLCKCACSCMHTHVHVCMHTYARAHTHPCICTHAHVCAHPHVHTHVHAHPCTSHHAVCPHTQALPPKSSSALVPRALGVTGEELNENLGCQMWPMDSAQQSFVQAHLQKRGNGCGSTRGLAGCGESWRLPSSGRP